MSDLATFIRETEQIVADIPRIHRDAQVAIAAVAYDGLIRSSPVLTGAYRAEHVLTEGDPQRTTNFLYESPSRPGPDARVEVRGAGTALEPPSAGDAKAAMASSVQPFGVIGFLNQRFYASSVEERHAVYLRAEDRARSLAERVRIEDPRFR